MHSLLYVSSRRLQPDAGVHDVDDIVTISRERNRSLRITGALVATPTHFAQILEGPAPAIDELMTSIHRDRRHYDIIVTPMEEKPRREFHRWSLAYHGDSTYVSGLFAAVLTAPGFALNDKAGDLRSLMSLLA